MFSLLTLLTSLKPCMPPTPTQPMFIFSLGGTCRRRRGRAELDRKGGQRRRVQSGNSRRVTGLPRLGCFCIGLSSAKSLVRQPSARLGLNLILPSQPWSDHFSLTSNPAGAQLLGHT